jgi:hypothetical protein
MKFNFDNPAEIDALKYSEINYADYEKQWKEWFDKQMEVSNSLPDGLHVGKIFSLGVADGNAYYEVVKVFKTKVRIKWRKLLCPDHYSDRVLGHGGSFDKHIIEGLVSQADCMRRMFSK